MSVDRERVDALYRAVNDAFGDDPRDHLDELRELVDPDVELILPREYIDMDVLRGHEGLIEWLEMASQHFETWRYELLDVRQTGDDRVVAILDLRIRGRSSEVEMVLPGSHLIDFRDGRMLRLEVHRTHEGALGAAGLSAS